MCRVYISRVSTILAGIQTSISVKCWTTVQKEKKKSLLFAIFQKSSNSKIWLVVRKKKSVDDVYDWAVDISHVTTQ